MIVFLLMLFVLMATVLSKHTSPRSFQDIETFLCKFNLTSLISADLLVVYWDFTTSTLCTKSILERHDFFEKVIIAYTTHIYRCMQLEQSV